MSDVIFDVSNFPKAAEFVNAVLSQKYRVILYGGAIRGGKTYNSLGALVLLHNLFPYSRSAIIRDSLETLKRNTLPSVEKAFPKPFIKSYNATDYIWTFTNGSRSFFFAENYDKDKELERWNGLEVNFILFDQIEEIEKVSFDKGLERVGSYVIPYGKKQPNPLIIGTVNPNHTWVKELVYDRWKKGTLPSNWLYIPAHITDNPHIPDNYKESLLELKETNPLKYRQFVEGDWEVKEKSGKEYYRNFDRSKHVRDVPYLPYLPTVCQAWDFNVDPYITCILSQVRLIEREGRKIIQLRIFKELCLDGNFNSIEGVSSKFGEWSQGKSVVINVYGDASGKNRKTGLGNVSDYDLIEQYFTKYLHEDYFKVLRRNPNLIKRKDFMNRLFTGNYGVEIVIDKSCVKTIKDFEEVQTGPNGKLKKMVTDKTRGVRYEEVGHPSDAIDYQCCFEFWESIMGDVSMW